MERPDPIDRNLTASRLGLTHLNLAPIHFTEDACDECSNEHEFIALLEDGENPAKSVTKKLCGNCLHQAYLTKAIIEAWTLSEWRNE